MRLSPSFLTTAVLLALLGPLPSADATEGLRTVVSPEDVEADWLRQAAVLGKAGPDARVRPEEDATGGCDGVINGTWGFHTQIEEDPWWQVDLGTPVRLGRVVLYNRTEIPGRASRIRILTSLEGKDLEEVYRHDGTVFLGHEDGKPLEVKLAGPRARFVRLQVPGRTYLHLDEVQVYPAGSDKNVALGRPATQSSISQWSVRHSRGDVAGFRVPVREVLRKGLLLADELRQLGVGVEESVAALGDVQERLEALPPDSDGKEVYLRARWIVRRLAFRNPLLDFDSLLFAKRAPATLPHMSDQYYGWWSRPGGGIYLLEDLRSPNPRLRCLTEEWTAGSFLRPEISHDGTKVLFAYARYYPHVAGMEKVDKEKLPEDAFYSLFEMRLKDAGWRQLTQGRYDDFDARYLPNGDIVFLSTRKGRFLRCDAESAEATMRGTCPDSYVRCGGDNKRPCAVFTLHTMNSDGGRLRAISAFENFEWTPAVAHDGRVLYARWDYIDRFNGHFMSLWSTNSDGTNAQLVYGNFTTRPQCIFEARPIPGSRKLVFTASAHHSITGGSLTLLDPAVGTEGEGPLERLTPEVCFPETEGWPESYYANPFPLSEKFHLVAWGDRRLPPHAGSGQITDHRNPVNALGLYLCDAFGNLELLYRDPEISSMYPLPVRPRAKPPVYASNVDLEASPEGSFLVQDVYQGLDGVERGTVKRLRVVAVTPKIQPHMNNPSLGVSKEDPGKFVLGTVPVQPDGSAFFRAPSGIPVFFQALDAEGLALQTMRTLTYVQPKQTLSCIGCHEPRGLAPPPGRIPLAATREPSRIRPAPSGAWPLRFDQLVQPVLDRACVSCHHSGAEDAKAARLDLTGARAYDNLLAFAGKDLEKLAFEKDRSEIGDCCARRSKLLAAIRDGSAHKDVKLSAEDLERLYTWMDTYAHRLGSFGESQEEELRELRAELADLLEPSRDE